MTVDSRRTSFFALTQGPDGSAPPVDRVEIPLFQRDYAQGRSSDAVERIRTDFLGVLHDAIATDDQSDVGLDFVYGGVDGGTLRPLDGQQRLTTLFLLHWYLASRAASLDADAGWAKFTYATRQSARMFCERLVEAPLPDDEESPSEWIKDQSWYLFLWRHDPTIQSMLVMIDAIHERFNEIDPAAAWARLTDVDDPAIWFLLLPLSELGSSDGQEMRAEDLYIKMNSRGKPLTEFENFKAHFEKTIRSLPRSAEFARKVDTEWSDLLWDLRGDDDLIDDEFLRYAEFVTEVCEWRDGRHDGAGQRLGPRTDAVFGESNPDREAHLDFLFDALGVWGEHDAPDVFEKSFTNDLDPGHDVDKVRLFFRAASDQRSALDLFEACCRSYGESRGRGRAFSLGQTLILYAVVLHHIEHTGDFARRLRVLRNLIEASADELRPDRMPKILDDVHRVMRDGAVEDVATLNQAQVADEVVKAGFLKEHPDLKAAVFRLEDHELLRGSLGAFDFDPVTFESRARAFESLMAQPELWTEVLGALLAVGEYQRQRPNSRPFLFGTDSKRHDNAWRELLTGATRDWLGQTRDVLAAFLDRVAAETSDLQDTLRSITSDYLTECKQAGQCGWRYFMVKYPAMREEGSSTYYAERTDSERTEMGYSLCMLRAGGRALNGNYRDPYLLAIAREVGDSERVEDAWFTGYESHPRRLSLTRSGTSIRCVPAGFELSPPITDEHTSAFDTATKWLGMAASGIVPVRQVEVDGRRIDTEDRIQRGADIVRDLLEKGL